MAEADRSLAIFIDFENLALGFQSPRERFDIARVLERLVEKGKIVAKKAYADWNRFAGFTHALHEAAIELIEIPRRGQTGKNSADIRLCVDAMDLAYSKEHINTFAIISGDSDFSPLVSKLKELGKHVIGLGMQQSTSDLLRDNCDEFIYYEDLGRATSDTPAIDTHLPEMKRKAFALLLESMQALRRENKDVLWSSMIKDTMKRKKPSFNETFHGWRSFSELLEEAAQQGLLELETDKRSRTYVVTRFGSEMHHEGGPPPGEAGLEPVPSPGLMTVTTATAGVDPGGPGGPRRSRRRRRGRGRGEGNGNGMQVARPGPMIAVPMNPPVPIPSRAEAAPVAPQEPRVEEVLVRPAPMPQPEILPAPAHEPSPGTGSDFAAGLEMEPAPAAPPPAAGQPAEGEAPKRTRSRSRSTAAKPAAAKATRTRRSAKDKAAPKDEEP